MIIFNLQESQRSCSKDILTCKQSFAPERWSSLVATALDCSMSEATGASWEAWQKQNKQLNIEKNIVKYKTV